MERKVHGLDVPVVSASAICGAVDVATASVNLGVVVPIPNPTNVLSQKKLVAFAANDVLFANWTAPVPPAAFVEPPVERHEPAIAKHPLLRLRPPTETSDEVAVVKFPTPCTEKSDPGVEVPTPTSPFPVIVSAGVEDVANVLGDEVER